MRTREAALPQPPETSNAGYCGAGTQGVWYTEWLRPELTMYSADPFVLRDSDEDIPSTASPLALNLELQHIIGWIDTTESSLLLAQCLDTPEIDRQRYQALETMLAESRDR